MDALGHINHASYFTYFEQARIAWWYEKGICLNDLIGPVLVKAEAEYLRSLSAPAKLTIELKAHMPGRSSYWIDYDLFESGALCAKGKTKVVWVDYQSNKSIPLPESMLEHINT